MALFGCFVLAGLLSAIIMIDSAPCCISLIKMFHLPSECIVFSQQIYLARYQHSLTAGVQHSLHLLFILTVKVWFGSTFSPGGRLAVKEKRNEGKQDEKSESGESVNWSVSYSSTTSGDHQSVLVRVTSPWKRRYCFILSSDFKQTWKIIVSFYNHEKKGPLQT